MSTTTTQTASGSTTEAAQVTASTAKRSEREAMRRALPRRLKKPMSQGQDLLAGIHAVGEGS